MPRPPPPQIPIPANLTSYAAVVCLVVVVTGYCQIFAKAGRKSLEALVPVHNGIVLAKIVGRPAAWGAALWAGPLSVVAVRYIKWWFMLERPWWALAVPGLLLTGWFHWKLSMDLAKSFGRGNKFGWRLTFLPFVFVPWLGWGYGEYKGPAATAESRSARRARMKAEEEKARAAYAARRAGRAPSPSTADAPTADAPAPVESRPVEPFVT